MARICLINPRFPTSFWGLNHGLPLLGKSCNMPVLALPTIAGLTPPEIGDGRSAGEPRVPNPGGSVSV